MATLDKLAICGIRNFSPEDAQYVEFDKPMTLLLGSNGSGKSTIIEALRFVTTQKEPAGKSNFVHDPSLAKAKAVKGFVKLRLTDRNGKPFQLCKSLEAKKTAKGVSVRNMDNLFSRFDEATSKFVSVSNRCLDFTPNVMRIFGLSKAIVENVLFCTQEESYWPLESDQKLKEKFDQIFDTDSYNKCLKKVRDCRKNLMTEIKACETELKHLKQNKEAAAVKRTQQETVEKEICDLSEKIEELKLSLVPIGEALKELFNKEIQLSQIHTSYQTTKAELQAVKNNENQLRRKIKASGCEFVGSDSDLEKALLDCDVEVEEVSSIKTQLVQIENKEKECSQSARAISCQKGELGKLVEIHQLKLKEKEKTIQQLVRDLPVTAQSTTLQFQAAMDFKEEKFKSFVLDNEKNEEIVQLEVDNTKNLKFKHQSLVKEVEDRLKKNHVERDRCESDLLNADNKESRVASLKSELAKTKDEYTSVYNIHLVSNLKRDIKRCEAEVSTLEEDLSSVDSDVTQLQSLSSVFKQVELQQEALATRSADIQKLLSRHNADLCQLFGTPPESDFKGLVEAHADSLSNRLNYLNSNLADKQKESATLQGRLTFLRDSLAEKKENLKRCVSQVLEATSGEDWEQSTERFKKIVDELHEEKGTLTSSSCMYQRYIRQLQKPKPCCPVCERDFPQDEMARNVADRLAAKMRDVPDRLVVNKDALDENQEKLNKLLSLQSVQELMDELKNREIPALTSELETVGDSVQQLAQEISSLSLQKEQPDKALKICSRIQGDMALLDQLVSDKKKIEVELKRLEVRIPSHTSPKDLQVAVQKQDQIRQSLKAARTKLQESQSKWNTNSDQVQKLQNRQIQLEKELTAFGSDELNKESIDEKRKSLEREEEQIKRELEDKRHYLNNTVAAKLNKAEWDLKKLKEKNKKDIEANRSEVERTKRNLSDLLRLEKELGDLQSKNVESQLKELEKKVLAVEEELLSLKTKKESLNSKLGSVAHNEVRRRELDDNKSLRQLGRDCAELENKLKTLKSDSGEIGYDNLMREKTKLKNEEERAQQKIATMNGRIGALTGQKQVIAQELTSRLFDKVEQNYNKEFINYRVKDACAKDLFRYAACMEWSMAEYHNKQMQRVNEYIREYWRKIYKGNDIDYVEIVTDQVQVSEKRRNYSYKLVMVKGEVSMDMRNRCSAGQKMLASLIIRMALAEVFSNNCGILTLDEPTTNLDQKNVLSLAETLKDILQAKLLLPNCTTQLIIISHDEEFIKTMMEVTGLDCYLHVFRNKLGRSRVKKRQVYEQPKQNEGEGAVGSADTNRATSSKSKTSRKARQPDVNDF